MFLSICATAATKWLQSCPTLCDPIEGSPAGSCVPGIVQARILEWVAITFSTACMHAKSLQLCPTLCDPMDSSPQASSVHETLQARILEWVAISMRKFHFFAYEYPIFLARFLNVTVLCPLGCFSTFVKISWLWSWLFFWCLWLVWVIYTYHLTNTSYFAMSIRWKVLLLHILISVSSLDMLVGVC